MIRAVLTSGLGACLLLNASLALAQSAQAPALGVNQDASHGKTLRQATASIDDRGVDRPRINETELRRRLTHYRATLDETSPSGLTPQVERGKPLPPGIAKRFEAPMATQLPHYQGYQWEHVGRDAVLIEASTRIVVDVVVDVLQ